jgi:hypothetical protein
MAPSFARTTCILSMSDFRYFATARKRNGTVASARSVSCQFSQNIMTIIPRRMRTDENTSTTESTRSVRTSFTSLVTRVIVSPVLLFP